VAGAAPTAVLPQLAVLGLKLVMDFIVFSNFA
jgi:hypothetical protein